MGFVGSTFRNLLAHPLTRRINLDDPRTTALRRQIIQSKAGLRHIYQEWYARLARDIPSGAGRVLELGSGAGFFKTIVPDAIASEIFFCPEIDLVADARRLPMADESLKAIVMTDVLHHLPDVRRFFHEATRCIRAGGMVAMIEPWVSRWSTFVYTRLHHEPFDPKSITWEFPTTGPLSGANGALPFIVFQRDREVFQREFPQWQIEAIEPFMPLRYLLSGGVSMRSLMPAAGMRMAGWIEQCAANRGAMFAHIRLRKRS